MVEGFSVYNQPRFIGAYIKASRPWTITLVAKFPIGNNENLAWKKAEKYLQEKYPNEDTHCTYLM